MEFVTSVAFDAVHFNYRILRPCFKALRRDMLLIFLKSLQSESPVAVAGGA